MSDTILNHIKEEDLSISEFADEFCDIVEEMYGKHNYKAALDIISSRLANGGNKQQETVLHLRGVSNAMLLDWWYEDEHGTEVTVKAIVDKWCIVTDIAHEKPYNVELEFVENMYKLSIDC